MENRKIETWDIDEICELDQDEILDTDRFTMRELGEMFQALSGAMDTIADRLYNNNEDLWEIFRELYDHFGWVSEAIKNRVAR